MSSWIGQNAREIRYTSSLMQISAVGVFLFLFCAFGREMTLTTPLASFRLLFFFAAMQCNEMQWRFE